MNAEQLEAVAIERLVSDRLAQIAPGGKVVAQSADVDENGDLILAYVVRVPLPLIQVSIRIESRTEE